MGDTSEATSSSKSNSGDAKPVIVRVKRKAFQCPLEAFWLEINERPFKRPLLNFGKLSLSESTQKEELKRKKLFVQHVETVSSSDAAIDILQSFVDPNFSKVSEFEGKIDARKRAFKEENKQNQLLSRSREKHESLAKSARFEQIWKKRRETKENVNDDSLREICHLYDIVCIDGETEEPNKREKPIDTSLEESRILSSYLPLLREFLPSAVEEIQSDLQSHSSKQVSEDGYVYDLYAVQNELNISNEDTIESYPLVQVNDDDDFYDGPIQSDHETDDSNAEDNPLNDYPDEETSKSESESESESASDDNDNDDDDEDEDESVTFTDELNDERYNNHMEVEDLSYEEEELSEDNDSVECGEDNCSYKFES